MNEMLKVDSDQQKEGKDYVDIISNRIAKFICQHCLFTCNTEFTVCPVCCNNSNTHDQNYDLYYRTKSEHPMERPVVSNAEPTLVNPSTYENVHLVISDIEKQVFGEDKKRTWVSVMCDGVPYTFASVIQDEFRVCSICSDFVYMSKLDKHSKLHKNCGKGNFSIPFSSI